MFTYFKQILYSLRVYRVFVFKRRGVGSFNTYNHHGLSIFRLPKFAGVDSDIPSEIDFQNTLRTIESHLNRSDLIRILDFGGGDLTLFRLISERIRPEKFEWILVEVPSMYTQIQEEWGRVQAGFKPVPSGFKVFEFPNLTICSVIPEGTFDVCIAGAVLGWVESPTEIFRELTTVSKTLVITRTLMENKAERLAIQRTIVGDTHLDLMCWFIDSRSLLKLTEMKIVHSWLSNETPIYTIFGKWHFRSMVMSYEIS